MAARQDDGQAEDAYHRALTLASTLGMRPLVAHCHLGLAEMFKGRTKQREALEHLDAAIALLRPLQMARWLADAERARARLAR